VHATERTGGLRTRNGVPIRLKPVGRGRSSTPVEIICARHANSGRPPAKSAHGRPSPDGTFSRRRVGGWAGVPRQGRPVVGYSYCEGARASYVFGYAIFPIARRSRAWKSAVT